MFMTPEDLCFIQCCAATGLVFLYGLPLAFGAARVTSHFFAAALVTEE